MRVSSSSPPPPPPPPALVATDFVLLPAEILSCSPSQRDGVPACVERDHRFFSCELIQEAGILLRLPQVVMVTAQTMLQRFFYRQSLRDFDAFRAAIGCLFLAAKVEERPKRIKDVVSVFYAMFRRRRWHKHALAQQLLELESESYYLWRDWLVMVERQILIDLGFSLYTIMEHPHKYILYYIKILDGSKAMAQRAWGYLNDSLRSDLCVRFRAEAIACAAIFLASRKLQCKLPNDPPWYELFDVTLADLLAISTEILALYKRPKVVWLEPLTAVNPFAVDDLPDEAVINKEGEVDPSTPVVADIPMGLDAALVSTASLAKADVGAAVEPPQGLPNGVADASDRPRPESRCEARSSRWDREASSRDRKRSQRSPSVSHRRSTSRHRSRSSHHREEAHSSRRDRSKSPSYSRRCSHSRGRRRSRSQSPERSWRSDSGRSRRPSRSRSRGRSRSRSRSRRR